MDFLGRMGNFARNVGDKAAEALKTSELTRKVADEKVAISELVRQIGAFYMAKSQEGEALHPDLDHILAEIETHNKVIAEVEAEIERLKAESEPQSQVKVDTPNIPAPLANAAVGIACTSCGKINPEGTKFCSDCGAKIEIPEPVATTKECPSCGVVLPLATRFCGECGHKFEVE